MNPPQVFAAATVALIVLGAGAYLAADPLVMNKLFGKRLTWPDLDAKIARDFPTTPMLNPDELAAWLNDPSREQPLLLDTREPDEFAVSHLKDAKRVSPGNPDIAQIESSANKDRPIVVYCSVGYRSARVAESLKEAGFTNVSNLKRSIFGWANAGLPVYRGETEVKLVHPYDKNWGELLKADKRAPLEES